MKPSLIVLSLALGAESFAPKQNIREYTRLEASRRNFLEISASLAIGISPGAAIAADIDYAKVQDLLGTSGGGGSSVETIAPGKRPTYLTEPTEEFKQNEAKASEFKRQQVAQKKEFLDYLVNVEGGQSEDVLLKNLDAMRGVVKKIGGLPEGITKEMIVKKVRARKRQKNWPTTVEIAYQDLINEIMYQQSPNTDRDTEGFL